MSSPDTSPRKSRDRQRFKLSSWLIDITPRFFDRTLQRVGVKHFKWFILLLLLLSVPLIVTPIEVWQQGLVAVFLVLLGQLIIHAEFQEDSSEISQYYHLFLLWLSMVTTLRYLYYRTSYTLNFDGWLNSIACLLLFAAELYAILTLVLAYFQTVKIQERQPVNLTTIPVEEWYKVDIYIPTYNEDVEIVRKTAVAALACDYAPDKKQVYVLDDGRPEKYKEKRFRSWGNCGGNSDGRLPHCLAIAFVGLQICLLRQNYGGWFSTRNVFFLCRATSALGKGDGTDFAIGKPRF